jgi:kynurenine formamidase
VLLDLPYFLRHPWLDEGTRILPQDLDNCAEALGVTVERGDIVLLRTGRLTRCFLDGSWRDYREGAAPGLSVHCARWLHQREVAAVASDTWSLEVIPNETEACDQPLHEIALDRTGLLVGKTFHLDTLSEACATDGEYAFLFTAPLLPALGAAGYPINPLAIK